VNIERFRPSREVETPSFMTSGQFLPPSVLFAYAALTRAVEVITKVF
jgi:hypothetical protein